MVALGPLEASVMVRIHAGQPIFTQGMLEVFKCLPNISKDLDSGSEATPCVGVEH